MEFEPVVTTVDAPQSQPTTEPVEKDVAEPTTAPVEETEGEKVAKGVQKRIDELTREKYQYKREVDQIAQRAWQVDQENAQMRQFLENERLKNSLPNPDQFNDTREYQAVTQQAIDNHNRQLAQAAAQAQQFQQVRQAQVAEQAQVAGVLSRITEKYNDATDVIGKLETINQTVQHHPAIRAAILQSPQAPEVLYYLGKNPQVAYELAAVPPMVAITKIGEIQAQLKAAQQLKPKSDANVSTLSGGSTSRGEPKDTESWIKWRNAQLKRK